MRQLLTSTALAFGLVAALAAPSPWSAGSGAHAQGVPTLDTAAIAQFVAQLEQMAADYALQLEQYTTQLADLQAGLDQLVELRLQYAQMVQQYEALTGARGIGGFLNAAADISGRLGADELTSVMQTAMTGVELAGTVGRMPERLGELRETFDLRNLGDLADSPVALDRAIAEVAGTGMAAMAVADDAYERSNAAAERVSGLITGIDDQADLKAATDYNTRMLGEVAALLVELMRVQAANANATGAATIDIARDRAAARRFMQVSDTPPEE